METKGKQMFLIVYRCFDNKEEESCFLVNSVNEAKDYLDRNPGPPYGFESRKGYYFFEEHE
jgi:hypothetical protein